MARRLVPNATTGRFQNVKIQQKKLESNTELEHFSMTASKEVSADEKSKGNHDLHCIELCRNQRTKESPT